MFSRLSCFYFFDCSVAVRYMPFNVALCKVFSTFASVSP